MARYVTGIARTIDPRYPSNVFAIVVAFAGGAVAFFPTLDEGFWVAVGNGILAGGAGFIAWAVARELDPDRPVVAGIAAVGGVAASFVGDPGLAVAGLVLIASRIVVRSTGLVPTMTDTAVVVAGAAYVATRPGGFPVAVIAGLALLADGRLPGKSANWTTVGADVTVVTAFVAAAWSGRLVPEFAAISGWAWVVLAIAAVGALLVVRPPIVTSETDWTRQPIDCRRVRASRVTALSAVIGAIGWTGAVGLAAIAPVAVAMLAALLPLPARRNAEDVSPGRDGTSGRTR